MDDTTPQEINIPQLSPQPTLNDVLSVDSLDKKVITNSQLINCQYIGGAGLQGPQGYDGPQGPQGYQGINGTQGSQGYQGPQGSASGNSIVSGSYGLGHNCATTGAESFAHGLGKTPKLVRISASLANMSGQSALSVSDGTYDGATQTCRYFCYYNSTNIAAATQNSYIVYIYTFLGGGQASYATISMDSINITLTWYKTGSPTGTFQFICDAIA